MCGIVGAVAKRDVVPILMDGLRRLEYRGYDSAGIAVLAEDKSIQRIRTEGKVSQDLQVLRIRAGQHMGALMKEMHTLILLLTELCWCITGSLKTIKP